MKENSIGDRIEEKYTRYINCETDILELTIEEAIFILEKKCKCTLCRRLTARSIQSNFIGL